MALEESKMTTVRDIDDIDEEVRAIETHEIDLERGLARNGFFQIFLVLVMRQSSRCDYRKLVDFFGCRRSEYRR